jgi:hypothetical protein
MKASHVKITGEFTFTDVKIKSFQADVARFLTRHLVRNTEGVTRLVKFYTYIVCHSFIEIPLECPNAKLSFVAFTSESRKNLSASFAMSICPNTCNNSRNAKRISMKFYIG